jgi:hypothetical protein
MCQGKTDGKIETDAIGPPAVLGHAGVKLGLALGEVLSCKVGMAL